MRVPKEKPKIRQFLLDDTGTNKLIIHNYKKTTIIFLKLKAEGGKTRKIGVTTNSTKTCLIKRKRSLHLFNKGNAYGFNDYVIRNAKNFNKIWLKDDISEWKIPLEFILDNANGQYFHFLGQGFELQKFFSLEEIEQFRVKKKERRRF